MDKGKYLERVRLANPSIVIYNEDLLNTDDLKTLVLFKCAHGHDMYHNKKRFLKEVLCSECRRPKSDKELFANGLIDENSGVNLIRNYLIAHKYDYEMEKQFHTCHMPFDFYLPKYRILIEFDGPSHRSKPKKERDRTKTAWCHGNAYKLIRINVRDCDKIPDILKASIKYNFKDRLVYHIKRKIQPVE